MVGVQITFAGEKGPQPLLKGLPVIEERGSWGTQSYLSGHTSYGDDLRVTAAHSRVLVKLTNGLCARCSGEQKQTRRSRPESKE